MPEAVLPEFDRPPVAEVVLSVKFNPTGLTVGHVGLLWQEYRRTFPNIEEHAPLDVPVEILKERRPALAPPKIEVVQVPRTRTWFVSEAGDQLVQVQHDFFAHNWRRAAAAPSYPRYAAIRNEFEAELKEFVAFLEKQELGTPVPVQCEVSYVNHITMDGDLRGHEDLHDVFRLWAAPSFEFLPKIDDGRFLARFVIPGTKGEFLGRLHLSVQPGFIGEGPEERQVFVATLTARGVPTSDSVSGILEFLDKGHEWIVRGFADCTTPRMHMVWGRTK